MNELTITTELKELTPEKSEQIKAVFEPMVKMLEGFEDAYNQVMSEEVTPELCKKAKRLRLDIGKIRIQADKKHKELKAEVLRTGRAIDGIRNILKFAVVDKEEKLKEIETHFERIEAERIQKLERKRIEELEQYDQENFPPGLGSMTDEVWSNYLSGVKGNYEAVKEAERKAEEERAEQERKEQVYDERYKTLLPFSDFIEIDELSYETTQKRFEEIIKAGQKEKENYEAEQERIRLENERLRKEREAAEAKRKKEEAARKRREEAEQKKREEERRKQEEALRKEREAREAAEAEARRKEEEEAERIRAEKEKKEKEEAERQEAERKAANAPDKEKLQTISDNILSKLDMFNSEEAKTAMRDAAQILFEAANRL